MPDLPEIDHGGDTFKLGCLVPPVFPSRATPITAAPGFMVWSRSQIEDAIRNKPVKRRKQFSGTEWIINQKNLGSCNPANATGAMRRAMAINGRNDVPILCWEFSYAQINGGVDQGSMLDDGMETLQGKGAPPLDTSKHPIGKHYKKNQFDADDYAQALKYRALDCFQLTAGPQGELELATLLLSGQGAGVVAVDVGSDFNNLNKDGMPPDGGGPGNHATGVQDVEIIGGELAFDMFNSWGLGWGHDGYCYLTWKRNLARTGKYHGFYAITSGTNPGGVDVA